MCQIFGAELSNIILKMYNENPSNQHALLVNQIIDINTHLSSLGVTQEVLEKMNEVYLEFVRVKMNLAYQVGLNHSKICTRKEMR